MIRIGDWIEIPQFNVDGDVIEISLNTVKIRNFDKTITTIPTYTLLTSGVKNWRGMQESGGRRIKRSLNIDINSIKFCNTELINKLEKIPLISGYIQNKKKISEETETQEENNSKALFRDNNITNVEVFRLYIEAYLKNNSNIHKHGFTFLIRQLQPKETGLPIEIYIFYKNNQLGSL